MRNLINTKKKEFVRRKVLIRKFSMTCGFRLFEFVCCGVDFKVVSIKTEINLNFEKQKTMLVCYGGQMI